MTLLNATLLPHGAWLSADSYVSPPTSGPTRTPGATSDLAVVRRDFRDVPRLEPPPRPIGEVVKVRAWSNRRVITASTGHLLLFHAWLRALGSDLDSPLDDLVEASPSRLRTIAAGIEYNDLLVLLLGWSERRRRCAGYVLTSPDFHAAPLPDGHASVPAPHPSDRDYPALYALWLAAAEGRDVERCHRGLAANQVRTCKAGLYVADTTLGGDLWMAEVTERGAACRSLGRL